MTSCRVREANKMSNKKEFKVEDIANNPNNLKNSKFTLPKEVSDQMNLKPGDPIKVYLGDQGTVIIEKTENKGNSQE